MNHMILNIYVHYFIDVTHTLVWFLFDIVILACFNMFTISEWQNVCFYILTKIQQTYQIQTRGLKSFIIPRHELGYSFCGHKYLKSRLVVVILNFSKIT